ncbi:MAG: alcohol dehydrogenase catalytic domain-containing protein [Verrucomicrobiota bacterium]
MKAALLTRHNAPLRIADITPGPLEFGQVLVRVLVSGICGAQLQEIRGEKKTGPLPHPLGHEGCGIVEDIGAGVTRVKRGDKVVMHWRKAAGIESAFPRYFLSNSQSEIRNPQFITGGLVTTFSEQSICSENRLTPVPPDTDPQLCALLGCSLSTALATIESETRGLGESVLVLGCGGLGLALLGALQLIAPAHVCTCDIHESKRRTAEIHGDSFVTSPADAGRKFDLVLDTAGHPGAMEAALEQLAPGGRYVMIGQPPPGAPVCINAARHMFEGEGKTIKATQGGGFRPDRDIPRYLAIASQLYVHNLITHVFPLEKINAALDLVRAGEAGRVLIECQPPAQTLNIQHSTPNAELQKRAA